MGYGPSGLHCLKFVVMLPDAAATATSPLQLVSRWAHPFPLK
jgi:hypothetical protein